MPAQDRNAAGVRGRADAANQLSDTRCCVLNTGDCGTQSGFSKSPPLACWYLPREDEGRPNAGGIRPKDRRRKSPAAAEMSGCPHSLWNSPAVGLTATRRSLFRRRRLRHRPRRRLQAHAASTGSRSFWPTFPVVMATRVLHAGASCVLGPVIAAISLGLVGHAALGGRLGRNARFASIGNGVAAAAMGACGYLVSNQAVFFLTAILAVPAVLALMRIRMGEVGQTKELEVGTASIAVRK